MKGRDRPLSAELLTVMVITIIILAILYFDARRFRKTHRIKKVEQDDINKSIYVATEEGKLGTSKNYKVMVLLHSLHCEKCNSENIKIEITPDNKHVRVICFDCGLISKISLKSIIP